MQQTVQQAEENKYQQLAEKIAISGVKRNMERIRAAYEFARDAHAGQLRKDGTPYVTHPLSAAEIVVELGLDDDSIIAALLHDTVEDTAVTCEEVAKIFGKSVADIVDGVTKLSRVTYTSKEEEQMDNLRKMLMAMAKDIRVILIKMADRLHNMRTMEYQSAAKQREKALETMEIYAPIAHRLGMQKIKWELEDLSILYLDPIGWREIQEEIKKRSLASDEFFRTTQQQIEQRLISAHVNATVNGRIKHMYSIYRKIYGQEKELGEVFDLYAFRVIVSDVAECYNVLGLLHDLFRPVPGRFKDYISTPKPNGYQSLHTTVIGTEGTPFEIQIRTWQMHEVAEYGVAAHWKYKEGVEGQNADSEKYAWIRKLLETQQDSDAQEFVHELKVDLFADEVFVFTPRGDVISLPARATPIDFAYSIHSAIGNKMTGCTVNGRIVPFSHVLQNGDIVEVLTSKSAKGPSRDWMSIAVSSEARNKIRQWFKKEKREENVAKGRLSFESELKHAGGSMAVITRDDVLPVILKRVAFADLDDMYAAIGYGGITATKVVNRIMEEVRKINREQKVETESLTAPAEKPPQRRTKPIHGIIVEGIENCLVRFSRCCLPVPGDPVVGFITRGAGISVHRSDCKNCQAGRGGSQQAARWVNVEWADRTEDRYQAALNITARDREGLIMDIAAILSAMKIKLDSLFARDTGDGGAVVFLTIQVFDKQELDTAVNKIMNVSGVSQVVRAGR